MGRINDQESYETKQNPVSGDTVLGNDSEYDGNTVLFTMESLAESVRTSGVVLDTGGFVGTAQDIVDIIPDSTSDLLNNGADGSSTFIEANQLSAIATSGDYNDLINTPSAPVIPDSTSDLLNNGADGSSMFIEANQLSTVAISGDYNDLINTPTPLGYTPENVLNKQDSLNIDGSGVLYPTVDSINNNVVNKVDTEGARLDPSITPIYAWGDSFTAGSGFTPYTTYLANLTKFDVTNKGISGETSTQIKDRLVAPLNAYPLGGSSGAGIEHSVRVPIKSVQNVQVITPAPI